MTQLQSAVVLITGATGGFGKELTRQLLLKGSRLILTDRHGEALQTEVESLHPTAAEGDGKVLACIEADLATRAGCEVLCHALEATGVAVDVLINNAGIALMGTMAETPPDQWEQLMQVNLLAPMRLSARLAADMVARRRGHIVNLSSLAGWIALPGLTAYATSKFGLRGFSEGLRHEVAPYNVKVTTVYPFFSRTPILRSPRFGVFAEAKGDIAPPLTTDPATVMARTIRAIERNQEEVFPDAVALGGHWLKRYLPLLPNWVSRRQRMGG